MSPHLFVTCILLKKVFWTAFLASIFVSSSYSNPSHLYVHDGGRSVRSIRRELRNEELYVERDTALTQGVIDVGCNIP
jgi:hypothetical protein